MKWALVLAAVGEAVTGVALLVVPSLVGQLLLGEELAGVAVPVARVAGVALIGLAVACWPGPPLLGMLAYSAPSCSISRTSVLRAVSLAYCCGRRSSCTRS
jgi:hypothetical protein